MKTKEELTDIYNSLNENQKFGVQFGMFPVKLMGLSKDEVVELMEIRIAIEKNDINKWKYTKEVKIVIKIKNNKIFIDKL